MPLSMVERGESREITDFRGQEEMKRHLQDLGFVKGEKIRVLGGNPGGMILMDHSSGLRRTQEGAL